MKCSLSWSSKSKKSVSSYSNSRACCGLVFCSIAFSSALKLGFQIFGEAAEIEQLAHRVGEFGEEILRILVVDFTGREIERDVIALADGVVDFGAFNDR